MSWVVAVSYPQREFRALASLQEHGFWAWLPTRTVRRKPQHLKREIVRTYPLFGGGYVFARDAEFCSVGSRSAGHRDLYGVDEIRAVVCWTDTEGMRRPLKISDDEMAALQHRVEHAIPIVDDVLCIGDSVFVTDGPFYTFTGKVARVDNGKGSLSVLLDIFGRKTPVEMTLEQLARAA